VLEEEHESLSRILPAESVAALQPSLRETAATVASRVLAYTESPEFVAQVHKYVARARSGLESQSIGEILPPEKMDDLAARAAAWAAEFSESEDLRTGVRDYLRRHADAIIASRQPLASRIPPQLVGAVEGAIDSYLPVAAAKLGTFLSDPASREKIREALHSLFRTLVKDLGFHQRLIAKLMVTERTFDKALDTLERDGVEQITALLADEAVREELTRVLREGIASFLAKPAHEIFGESDHTRVTNLVDNIGGYVLKVLRDPNTNSFIAVRLRDLLEGASRKSVADFFSAVSDESAVSWIISAARSDSSKEFVRDGVERAFVRALEVRIGRPARWLPDGAGDRIAAALSPFIWKWIHDQLPRIIAQLDVEGMVERKVNGFSIQRMEELVRGVTERELKVIVKLGYVLGGMIGLMTFGISMLFR
jgi:uncharacterized membrane protein YheB (UPF0754 family)